MRFEVYCDESRPDLFASQNPPAQFMVIGSLWLQTDSRGAIKEAIHALRNKHKIGGEFKWQKVSPSRELFYQELVSCFLDFGDRIAVSLHRGGPCQGQSRALPWRAIRTGLLQVLLPDVAALARRL